MIKIVQKPNLPINCKTLIIGEKYYDILKPALEVLEITAIKVPENPNISPIISSHADMSVCHTGGDRLVLAAYLKGSELEKELKKLGMTVVFSKAEQRDKYPHDVTMNICAVGDNVFCGAEADKNIINYLTNRGCTISTVRQGYSRCSVCVVDDNSVITADGGIAAAAKAAGLEALLTEPGHIELSGYDYGFIGGSAFKISSDKLAFTGRIDTLPDCERILEFLKRRSIKPVFLTDNPIFDIGGAIPIIEK